MSVSTLNNNVWKTWADLRVQDINIYGTLTYTPSGNDFNVTFIQVDVTGFNSQPGRTTSIRIQTYGNFVVLIKPGRIRISAAFQVNGQPLILGTLPEEYRPSTEIRSSINIIRADLPATTYSEEGVFVVRTDGVMEAWPDPQGTLGYTAGADSGGFDRQVLAYYEI